MTSKNYDYLIVGSGLFGATVAYELAKKGKTVKIIEKRDHIGGNIYTENVNGIEVHKYGAHIFHTSNEKVWNFINKFAKFNNYINSPLANYHGEIYNLPFNMNTFNKMWGVITPEQAKAKIADQKKGISNRKPSNLEEQAISLVGHDIYEKLIKGYTEKQWGKKATELPSFIIRRLPVRFSYNNNYFNDLFQGIPIGGYTQIINKMIDSNLITVETNADFFDNKEGYLNEADIIVYTGMVDEFFDYQLGILEYRSLKFETVTLDVDNFQGNAVVNYTDAETPFTRIIEHKYFDLSQLPKETTVVTREYPSNWHRGDEPYYPVNDSVNNGLYKRYVELAKKTPNVVFGGRLGFYRYYNMDQTILAAFKMVDSLLSDGNTF